MPQKFVFATAGQINFGNGVLSEIGPAAAGFGHTALIAAGVPAADRERLTGLLKKDGVDCEFFTVPGEPTVELVLGGVEAARKAGCDLVIGFGGGSALDTAKAVAALLTNPGDPLDYLEVVGNNQPLTERPAPFIAIPTTAGTGSEVTRNAVLAVPEKHVKVSLRSPMMLARAAFIDPELTYHLPPEITAATGMDALAQVIEPYVSNRANPMTDLYCREGIRRNARSLLLAYRDGTNEKAREDLAFASLMGGLALANAGLGAVHGFAGPIGGMYSAPHGAVCAALLPAVVLVNSRALAERDPRNPAMDRYLEISRVITENPEASITDLTQWSDHLREALNIPGLSAYGVETKDYEALIENSAAASSMKANPLPLTKAELREILELSA